ncbi:Mariner Mos1 transposase, partial [Stegodyphus mimosarum]
MPRRRIRAHYEQLSEFERGRIIIGLKEADWVNRKIACHKNRKLRLSFEKSMINTPEKHRNNVLFADESKFNIFGSDGRITVRRRKNEELHSKNLVGTVKHSGGGVLVLGCRAASGLVWSDYKGIVYFELLPPNRTINSDVYIEQLAKLNNAVEEKRPESTNRKGVVFHHDNAKPHTSLITRQKLLELGWDVFPHPPYSPDLAPSDYVLFRPLQNSLNGKNFNNDDDVKSYLIQFFANKNQKFYERGIMMLPERWQKVIDQNGQYITE